MTNDVYIQWPELMFLPPETSGQLLPIIYKYYDYFFKDLEGYIVEIQKIDSHKLRKEAFLDLQNSVISELEKLRKEYVCFLEGLSEFHNFKKSKETNTPTTGKNRSTGIFCLPDYSESFEHEVFMDIIGKVNSHLNTMDEHLRTARIKEEINEKFNIKKRSHPGSKTNHIIDINAEFKKLFINEKICSNFIAFLKARNYISDSETWIGVSKNPGELREAYYALEELELLSGGIKPSFAKKIFYKRFGLVPEEPGVTTYYISGRALRNALRTDDYDYIKELLTDYFKRKK